MSKIATFLSIAFSLALHGQDNLCNLEKSSFDIYKVDAGDIRCLAQKSEKRNTVFLTFARWCAPCMYHLPDFLKMDQDYNVDLYVLLIDPEQHKMTKLAVDYINESYPGAKILVLKDLEKGNNKKYKEFLKEITPPRFEFIKDMSKYIVLDQKGDVQLVTSYKDAGENYDWKDDKPMVRRVVLPILEKKELSD